LFTPVLSVFTDVILPVIAVAAVGGVVGRRIGLQLDTLQRIVFYLLGPALVFDGLASVTLEGSVLGRLVLVAAIVFVANALLALAWSRLRRADAESTASIAMSSIAPNQGNLGLPTAVLAFGAAGLEVATVFFVIGTVLNSSAGIGVGQFAMRTGNWRQTAMTPFRYPAIYAALAGILVNVTNVDLPVAIDESASSLAQASIPIMLVILGMSFHVPKRGDLVDPVFVSVNRLVVAPLVAYVTLRFVGVDDEVRNIAVLMTAMPTAVNTTILAGQLGANVGLAVRSVVISTGLSLVTLSVLIGVFLQ
jgi:predicted permease